jgi:hypothetical protein
MVMARPKKHPQFEPTGFHQAVRARFIEFARIDNAPALHLLGTRVWLGEISAQDWAKSLNVAQTWVEQWAQDTIASWKLYTAAPTAGETGGSPRPWWIMTPRDPLPPAFRPYRSDRPACPPPFVLESGKLDMEYPLPRAIETDLPIADTSASWTQTGGLFENGACEQHGTPTGGAPWLNSNECLYCGRKTIGKRRKLRERLDDETAKLDSKIGCAAVYVLSSRTIENLARSRYISTPAMYGWLKEAMALLDLKMRPPGHRHILK